MTFVIPSLHEMFPPGTFHARNFFKMININSKQQQQLQFDSPLSLGAPAINMLSALSS